MNRNTKRLLGKTRRSVEIVNGKPVPVSTLGQKLETGTLRREHGKEPMGYALKKKTVVTVVEEVDVEETGTPLIVEEQS